MRPRIPGRSVSSENGREALLNHFVFLLSLTSCTELYKYMWLCSVICNPNPASYTVNLALHNLVTLFTMGVVFPIFPTYGNASCLLDFEIFFQLSLIVIFDTWECSCTKQRNSNIQFRNSEVSTTSKRTLWQSSDVVLNNSAFYSNTTAVCQVLKCSQGAAI